MSASDNANLGADDSKIGPKESALREAREEDLSIPAGLDRTRGMSKEDFDKLHDKLHDKLLGKPAPKGKTKLEGDVATVAAAVEIIPPSVQAVLDENAEAIRANVRRTISGVLDTGRRLAEVKKLLGHGNWLPWLQREFAWSEDIAERMIALHALQLQIPHVEDLSLPISGLYLLARRSTPPEVVEEVVAKAEAGERVTVEKIETTIKARTEANSATSRKVRHKLPSYRPQQPEPPPPAPTPTPLADGFVALAHKHVNAIVNLMRQHMSLPERLRFRQEMLRALTDEMVTPPAGSDAEGEIMF